MAENQLEAAVLVPCFNRKPFVKRCLLSLQRQTWVNAVYVFVDDGSTDGTSDLLDGFASSDKRFIVIHQPNKGVASARNELLKAIRPLKPKFLFWVDSDDYIANDYLERLILVAKDFDADVVRASAVCFIGTETGLPALTEEKTTFCFYTKNDALSRMCRGEVFPLWGAVYKTSLFENLSFDERLSVEEDFAILPRILQRGARFIDTNYRGYFYQDGSGHFSLSKQKANNRVLLSTCQAEVSCIAFLKTNGLTKLADIRSPFFVNKLLGLYGGFDYSVATHDEIAWLLAIKNIDASDKTLLTNKALDVRHELFRFLYHYAEPIFTLGYKFHRVWNHMFK